MTEERNYEYRTISEVHPRLSVNRDGEVRIDTAEGYPDDRLFKNGMITALDGSKMSIQMFIHKAFPDIPLRHAELLAQEDSLTYAKVIERQNIRDKIRLAKKLGFHDDVKHWESELKKLGDD